MINKVTLIGNTGSEADIKRLESGAVVAKFSLATNKSYKDKAGQWQDQTQWHNLILWGPQAEKAERLIYKGAQVYAEGEITYRTWEDKDGNNRKTTEIVVNYFRLLGRKEEAEAAPDYVAATITDETPLGTVPEEDLPF